MPPISSKNSPLNPSAAADLGIGNAGTPSIDQETEEERKRRLMAQQQQQAMAAQNSYAATALLGPAG